MAASRRRRWRCYSFPELVNREVLKTLDANFDYDVEAFRNETKDYGTISGGRGYFGWPQAGDGRDRRAACRGARPEYRQRDPAGVGEAK